MMDGPFADDFTLGTPLPPAPSITIDAGVAASYQAITGDPLRLSLSDVDSAAVTGQRARLVNPCLVLQLAIGQSTVATKRVIANLYYRDVALWRQVHIDDSLTTTVTPIALALTRPGPNGRRAKVRLRIETLDQHERIVARFERLALLPCRDAERVTERGELGETDHAKPLSDYVPFLPADWQPARLRAGYAGIGDGARDPLADTVSGALELVRLTQNQAAAHRDPSHGLEGRRLVYGGHTIGLAQASLARMADGLVTVLGWRSCDHLAPVFEGDVLEFQVSEVDRHELDGETAILGFRVLASVRDRPEAGEVLDWRPVALMKIRQSEGVAS